MCYENRRVDAGATYASGTCERLFDAAYQGLYGRLIPGLDVEVLSWTLPCGAGAAAGRVRGWPAPGGDTPAGQVLRYRLAAGDRVPGPAKIVEDQTVIVVPAGQTATLDQNGNVLVRRTHG